MGTSEMNKRLCRYTLRNFVYTFFFVVFCTIIMSAQAKEVKQNYSDVDFQSTLGQAVEKMAQAGIIDGYPDGTFKPNGYLTRAEFVKIANLQFGLLLSDEKVVEFADVNQTHWAYQQVKIARKAGYIAGVGKNCFAPSATLSREQFCVMVGRIQNYQDLLGQSILIKDKVSDWAKSGVTAAISCGLFALPEDGWFRATEPITRGEVCLALAQFVQPSSEMLEAGGAAGSAIQDPIPDDIVKEEAEIAGYISEMLTKYNSMNLDNYTTEAVVKDMLVILMECMESSVNARQNGILLSREYINQQYSEQISQFKDGYNKMTANQINDTQVIVGNLAELYKIEAVMDYFGVELE